MLQIASSFLLKIAGWKIVGQYPASLPSVVFIGAPHTNNLDFLLCLLVRSAVRGEIRFVAKDAYFRYFPVRLFMQITGGYPVDKRKSSNFVQTMVGIFQKEKSFHLAICPEGTRRKVDKLKTGFWYIAKDAGAAIVMTRFDWGRKEFTFSEPFYPSGDLAADLRKIDDYFRGVKGRNPERGYLNQV